jgi:hypothetical protein
VGHVTLSLFYLLISVHLNVCVFYCTNCWEDRRDSGQAESTVVTNPRNEKQRRLSQSARKLTPHYDEKTCLLSDRYYNSNLKHFAF